MNDSPPAPSSAAGSSVLPPVTAIMVARNDRETIEAALQSIAAQSYPLGLDIIVAVGPNTDGTTQFVEYAATLNPRLTVLTTRSASPVIPLNEAIAAARSSLIVRVDPRSELPVDYTRHAVEAMVRTDAAALVGRTVPIGVNAVERAVAKVFGHRLGLAADPLKRASAAGPTNIAEDHVLRRRMFIEAGLFDEEIRHGQAWEMNQKLREAGHSVVFVPELSVTFRPPSRVVVLTRSLFAEGLWRGEFARAFPESTDLRFPLPPAVVVATILGFILGAGGLFGLVAGALGAATVVSFILFALLLVPIAYVVGVLVLGVIEATRSGARTGAWFALVLPLAHFSWGFGYLAGFFNLEGAADTVIVNLD
ncbi:glycosyltransferase [Subtercola boreus]|uniref:Glycosyltransferase 2-like domain-containing protein n=1 Tax=Subtercola boreus TaxID=120213 RepID=A0A3E0WBI7_9MICO|nr:glycosyltransferase [Subtercola boreus]RFA20347.1 hypothetical protein B7R24_10135 [Subtercola boreus]RFA20501.1 hypothetical protein B7R23_10075 [Subtercola boreus]RFA26750.1 hypothetical protein B7R25_10200 [Subtercola boreus]